MFIIKLRGNTTSDLKLMYGKIGEKKFVNREFSYSNKYNENILFNK